MKIIDIKIYNLYYEFKEPIFDARSKIIGKSALIFELEMNNGIIGLGEIASYGNVGYIIKQILLNKIFPIIKNKECVPKSIIAELNKVTAHYGQKGLISSIIAGIELALWDALAKLAKLPLCKLFGGEIKPINIYSSTGFYLENKELSYNKLIGELERLEFKNFSGIKIKIGKFGLYDDLVRINYISKIIEHKNKFIIIDANNSYSVDNVLELSNKVGTNNNILFIEEPIPFGNVNQSLFLRKKTNFRIGGYELEFGFNEYKKYIDSQAVDFIQPDCVWTIGISEAIELAQYAKRNSVGVIPHNFSSSIALAANYHFLCSSDIETILEFDCTDNPFISNDIASSECFYFNSGKIEFNKNNLGLGIELNYDFIKEYIKYEEN